MVCRDRTRLARGRALDVALGRGRAPRGSPDHSHQSPLSFGYNLIALTAAALGFLQPILEAALMAGSSVLVVMDSMRLQPCRTGFMRDRWSADSPSGASAEHIRSEGGIPAHGVMGGAAAGLSALAHLADEHFDGFYPSALGCEGEGIGESVVGR